MNNEDIVREALLRHPRDEPSGMIALDALVKERDAANAEADKWCDRADQAEMHQRATEAERDKARQNAWTPSERDEWSAACQRSAEAKYRYSAEILERERDVALDRITALENELDEARAAKAFDILRALENPDAKETP